MRVVATTSFKAYVGGVPLDVAEGDHIKGVTAAYLLEVRAPVRPLGEQPASLSEDGQDPAEPEENTGVPDGTTQDVLDWVGDDPERAVLAAEAEQAADKPRSTLLAKLNKIAGTA